MVLSTNAVVTLQAGVMALISNVIAQCGRHYKAHQGDKASTFGHFDVRRAAYFVLYALLATPPNFEWQNWLESKFPGWYTASKANKHKVDGFEKPSSLAKPPPATVREKKLNKQNTLVKFLLDQIVGGTINTITFIWFFAYIDGKDPLTACQREFWPMRVASLKLWPAVSLLNYTVIPVQHRINFANLIGIGWGIYLSLLSF